MERRRRSSALYRSRHGKVPVTRLPGGTLSVLLPALSFPLSAPYAVGEASVTRTRTHRHTLRVRRAGEGWQGIGGRVSVRGIACHREQP